MTKQEAKINTTNWSKHLSPGLLNNNKKRKLESEMKEIRQITTVTWMVLRTIKWTFFPITSEIRWQSDPSLLVKPPTSSVSKNSISWTRKSSWAKGNKNILVQAYSYSSTERHDWRKTWWIIAEYKVSLKRLTYGCKRKHQHFNLWTLKENNAEKNSH